MNKINRISPDDNAYVQIISAIDSSIKTLYYRGSLPNDRRPSVAIVGARKLTAYGKEMAYRLAYDLAKKGVVIVSGLALGIDAVAHRGALDAGGTTVAVLANGVDKITPTTHRELGERILSQGGAIISEYEPGTQPYKEHFIARNRIVSGLSDALIVVEAAKRSGTLSTAGFALDQGKAVFALPGNVTSLQSEGCNELLKQGAMPVTEATDVLKVLNLHDEAIQPKLIFGDNDEENAILDLMKNGIREGDVLLRQSGLSAALFNQTLTMLEIKGVVRALGGNQWALG